MKIALAVTLAEPGGVQQFLAGFSVWLKNRGYEVTVIAGDGAWLEERCEANGIAFIRLKKMGREINPLRDPSAILELRRVLKDLKPDAIHLNSAKMSVVGSIAARILTMRAARCGMRVVYRIGGWTFREALPAHKLWLYRSLEKWTGHLKDVIVCVNPDDVRLAHDVGIKARELIVAVPNGIDLARFDATLLPRDTARSHLCALRSTLCESHFIFGTTANFYPPKDLPRYMEACKIVHDAEPSARFLILGDGLQRAEIETKRHALGLDEAVSLPGARNDATALLAGFDAFVLPSSKEGMAFSLLEAMAARLPCVATDVGAAKWMLADAGLVVPKMDPKALAEAMLRIIREPDLRAKLATGARHQIETRFPLEETYQGNLKALTK